METEECEEGCNPLDLSQWLFCVLSNAEVASTHQKSISLSAVEQLAVAATAYADLARAVSKAALSGASPQAQA